MQSAPSPADYQRALRLWWWAALDLPAAPVATALGWHVGSVYNLPSRYLHDGSATLIGVGRGGRRQTLLSEEQETQLMSAFASLAGQGGVVEASVLRRTYEEKVGAKVAKSTVYRLLARQGWRKLVPRPYHPDTSKAAAGIQKKLYRRMCTEATRQAQRGLKLRLLFEDEARLGRRPVYVR